MEKCENPPTHYTSGGAREGMHGRSVILSERVDRQ